MSVGFSATKADFDAKAGSLALALRQALANIKEFQAVLAATADATLTADGYTSGEVATLKSAYTDLDKLRTIYEGTQTQGSTYDFRQFAKLLTGVV